MHQPEANKFDPLGYMSGSFLVFRGVILPHNVLQEYARQIGKRKVVSSDKFAGFVNLPGSTSTSESFKVALQFAKLDDESSGAVINSSTHYSVLFVICIHNYNGFRGFRMNSSIFSAHPNEREILLMEGIEMCVVDIEEVFVDNLEEKEGEDGGFW